VRFVRRGTIASTPGASIEAHDLVDLERRVHDLEERMREAATALGPKTS
jgi:hypothetical protein